MHQKLRKGYRQKEKDKIFFVSICIAVIILIIAMPFACSSQTDWRDFYIQEELKAAKKINPLIAIDTIIYTPTKWVVKYKIPGRIPQRVFKADPALVVQQWEAIDSCITNIAQTSLFGEIFNATRRIKWYSKNGSAYYPAIDVRKDKSFDFWRGKVTIAYQQGTNIPRKFYVP